MNFSTQFAPLSIQINLKAVSLPPWGGPGWGRASSKAWHAPFIQLLLVLLTLAFPSQAQKDIPDAPNPPRLVNDFGKTLSADEAARLEEKLRRYADSTSTQIAVISVEALNDYEVGDYAERLGEKWRIGSKKDNGVVLLYCVPERKVTIQTGYGAEGVLPDGVTQDIIQNKIKPAFKQQQYYQGLDAATDEMIARLSGEYKGDPKASGGKDGKGGFPLGVIILLVVIALFILSRAGRGGGGTTIGGNRNRSRGGGFWPMFLPTGGFGGGGGSSWGGGGGGGTSFGGFGGGSFGGGGSSGSW